MITKVAITSYIDGGAPGPEDEEARMILATTAGDMLSLGIVVDLEQTDEVPSKTLDGTSTDIDTVVQRLRQVSQEMFDQPTPASWVGDVDDAVAALVALRLENFAHEEGARLNLAFTAETRELGARAARLVADMLQQAGRYLTHGYGEINEVLLEARVRGWLEPIE